MGQPRSKSETLALPPSTPWSWQNVKQRPWALWAQASLPLGAAGKVPGFAEGSPSRKEGGEGERNHRKVLFNERHLAVAAAEREGGFMCLSPGLNTINKP